MYLKKDIFGKIKGIVQEDSKLNKSGAFAKRRHIITPYIPAIKLIIMLESPF